MPLDVDVAVGRGAHTIAVAFTVEDGETVALLGPNGAGKTSALEAIAGIADATGRVTLNGRSLMGMPPERRGIGVAFQDGVLFPKLSVLENVAFPLRAAGAGRDDARDEARAVLRDVAPTVDDAGRPTTLSGGERQRVALARALAAKPAVLLLDEPFAAVDAEAKPELRAMLRQTLASFPGPRVLVTHDPVEAMTLADRLVLLEDGRVTQAGTPEEVRRRPATRYAAELVGTNLFTGELVPDEEGVGLLRTGSGELTVVWPDRIAVAPVPDVRATLSPAEIALHTEEPHGSARNVFHGAVEEVATVGGRARVRLRTAPPLVAEITPGSAERLGIVPGREVWASCKAVEIRLMVPGEEPDTL
jgi:molybdate transport system ATP-binding protein